MNARGERLLAAGAAAVLLVGAWTVARGDGRAPQPAPASSEERTSLATLPVPSPSTLPTPVPAPVRRAAPAHVAAPVPAALPRTGCPVPVRPSVGGRPRPLPAPTVADSALPAPIPVRAKASSLAAVRGKGLWVTPFARSTINVPSLVRLARSTGVRSLWVRTGGSRQGYYGDHFLARLVPTAHAAGIAVVAWDFPTLSDPVADARRAELALATGVDGFSPDVETRAEGTYGTPRRLAVYLSLVRAAAGVRPVVATVPRPTPLRQRTFPYRAFVPYADVFAPMVYWSCKEPGALVQQSLAQLGKLLPVAPVGQAYDMGPEGGRVGVPSYAETLRFLDAARRAGAVGASLWTVEHAGRDQLRALSAYRWPTR